MEPQGREASQGVRSLIGAAIAEAALAEEQLRIDEMHQRRLEEQLEGINLEVQHYREMVQSDENAVDIAQDNIKTKEANTKLHRQLQEPTEKKVSALEKQLEEERRISAEQSANLEASTKRVEKRCRRVKDLQERVKRPYNIDSMEKQIAELEEAIAMKRAAVRECDEALQKLRAEKKRAAQDSLNNSFIEIARLYVQRACGRKKVEVVRDEVQQLESTKALLQSKAWEQTQERAPQVTWPSQLRPVGETPQNQPCSMLLDETTSSHFEVLALPSTSRQSAPVEAPKSLEKGPPPHCPTPNLSPQLMPPPQSRVPIRPRSTSGGRQLDTLMHLGKLESLLPSACSPKPQASQRKSVLIPFGNYDTTPPSCKKPRIGDNGASSSTSASKPARQHPQVPSSERTSSSLAVKTTSVPADAQHKSNLAHFQSQVIPSQSAATNDALSISMQASSKMPQDKRPVAASSMGIHTSAPRDQMSAGHTRQQEDLTLRRAQVSQCSVDQHSLKELSTAGPSRTAQREPLLQSLATSRLSSNEVQADRPLHPAQRARPSDSQQAMEEIDLAGPSNLAQGEPAKLLSTSPKWMMGLQQQRSHQVQFEWQVTEQMGLPVPNLVPGAPAKAASVLAKSGMSLQEPQLHRTVPPAQPAPARGQRPTSALTHLPGPSRAMQKALHPSTASSSRSKKMQEPQPVGQPPEGGHALEETAAANFSHAEHKQPAQSFVTSSHWEIRGEQFPQQGGRQETTDSQISKEFPPEFSLVAGPSSPTASVGSAGYNLFEDDDDSGQGGGFFSKAGAINPGPRFTF